MAKGGLAAWCAARVRRYRESGHSKGACGFDPSCSAYAIEALTTRRLPSALALIASRLLRCNPLVRRVTHDPVARRRPHAPRPNSVRTLAAVLALSGTVVLLTAGTAASDEITGGCTGTINGRNAETLTRDNPLKVSEGQTVSVEGNVPEEFAPQNPQSVTRVEIEILADILGRELDEHVSNGPTYSSDAVDVDDYLEYGAGLYRVTIVNTGQGWRCEYAGYLELDENPLTTPIGIAASAGVVVGAGGVLFAKGAPKRSPRRDWVDQLIDDHDTAERDDALRRVRHEGGSIDPDAMVEEATYHPFGPPCCLSALALPLAAMPLFGMAGGAAAMPSGAPVRVVWSKVVLKRGHPIWGFLAGALFGLGASVLLWQYSVWLLSLWTLIVVPVVVGLLAAVYVWYGRRYRVRVLAPDGGPPAPATDAGS